MNRLHIKDPGSAITHFIAMVLAILAATPLLLKSYYEAGGLATPALAVFIASMILLYAASTIYHTLDISPKVNKLLRKVDHMMIFILIAGTYTPVCMVVLGDRTGWGLLALVWSIALLGILIKACWITCPKWFSSILYIAMGWVCLAVFGTLWNTLSLSAFLWLLAGGIMYTVGGVIYGLKVPLFDKRHLYFGSHEIFHIFVMLGSACHFIVMYVYVCSMPLV